MRVELESGPVQLGNRRMLRIREGAGTTVRCEAGTVWITEEAEPQDVILQPGSCYRLKHGGLALVAGFGEASVSVN